tara:strand:- start:73 stop:648 length:576 start_codon:yes stop_codon:yes gene_type:complete
MQKRNLLIILFIISIILSALIITYKKKFSKHENNIPKKVEMEEPIYNSNIIDNINYVSKDAKGNEYTIKALKGEVDFSNPNIIYLENVRAVIKLSNSNNIIITSDYGKYNSSNYDTIFSINVKINYLENEITSEYLDFSLNRNSMIISRDVVYISPKNVLKSDVIEINIETKDTKIFMYEENKKVKIISNN